MKYSLLPFPTYAGVEYEGLPDLRAELESRPARVAANAIGNLDLLGCVVELLEAQPWDICIDHCCEAQGRLHLAVFGKDLGRQVGMDDEINAGFYLTNCERGTCDLQASSRIYRVACWNGALVESGPGQSFSIGATDSPPADWRLQLERVVECSFSGHGIDADAARFRNAVESMVVTPYEMLCHLAAQGLITEEDQSAIQAAFTEAGDSTQYGFINAVTSIAHDLRANDQWVHAFQMERLGGEILYGHHDLPALDAVYS